MADNRPPIQVYIENAADSTIGGFTIPLPTTKETLAPWLAAIEVDGSNPNGTDIKEIKSSEMLMRALRHRNHHLEELNYLAARIKGMNPSDTDMFMAVLETGRFDGDITKIINLTENLGRYDLQPAFIAEQYGDFLIDNAKDETADALGRLEKSDNSDDRVLAAHILRLESYIDAAAYGRGMAELEDGVFTQHGYLIEVAGDPHEVYRGPEDIPREYRLFNEPGPLAVRDVDLAPFLLKLHALAGDYGRNVSHNLETLSRLRSTDYLLLLDGKSAYLTEAAHAYRRGTTAFDIWMRAGGETEQAFAIHLTEVHSRLAGDVYQIDVTERQKDLINHSVQPVRIDASLKNGGTQSYLPDEWSALPLVERDRVQDWVRVFRDEDYSNIHRHIDNITAGFDENGRTIEGDTLLSNLNAAYMEESRYPDYGYLRVSQDAAKEMLARGDADVYRLLPHEMEKLSTMDAVKSGLWFSEHREFAIKREDLPGLNRWAERSAGDMLGRSQERGEHKKNHEPEI